MSRSTQASSPDPSVPSPADVRRWYRSDPCLAALRVGEGWERYLDAQMLASAEQWRLADDGRLNEAREQSRRELDRLSAWEAAITQAQTALARCLVADDQGSRRDEAIHILWGSGLWRPAPLVESIQRVQAAVSAKPAPTRLRCSGRARTRGAGRPAARRRSAASSRTASADPGDPDPAGSGDADVAGVVARLASGVRAGQIIAERVMAPALAPVVNALHAQRLAFDFAVVEEDDGFILALDPTADPLPLPRHGTVELTTVEPDPASDCVGVIW